MFYYRNIYFQAAIVVQFIDYGNIEEIDKHKLYSMDGQDAVLTTTEPCCIECTLNGSESGIDGKWTDAEIANFLHLFDDNTYVEFELIRKHRSGSYVCRIIRKCGETLASAIKVRYPTNHVASNS
jgi:hypothetical protein